MYFLLYYLYTFILCCQSFFVFFSTINSARESIERVFVTGLTPFLAKQLQQQLQQLQQPKVNFKDIGDMAKSSRDQATGAMVSLQ